MMRTAQLRAALIVFFLTGDAVAIDVVLDFRYDTIAKGGSDFFGDGNPDGQGSVARETLQATADFYSSLITDQLNAISFINPTTPGPDNTPVWRQVITHPGTGQLNYAISSAGSPIQDGLSVTQGIADEFRNLQVPADTYLIYVGATNIDTVGIGGTGVGFFGTSEFNDSIDFRGKPEGEFSTWGGYLVVDSDASWHYDHTISVVSKKTDLYSIALHEIGHALGLNTGFAEWNDFQIGPEFRGPATLAAWKAEDSDASPEATGVPTESSTNPHWKENEIESNIVGTTSLQECAMDPTIFFGKRKRLTNVDAYGLQDIGWDLSLPIAPGDFNLSGFYDAEDIGLLQDQIGTTFTNSEFDLDRDGTITASDVDRLAISFMGTRPGDLDLDWDIDTGDLTHAIIGFTGAGGTGQHWAQGDNDSDGDVDTTDLTIAIMGFTGVVSDATPIPEPPAILLVTTSLLFGCYADRRALKNTIIQLPKNTTNG